MPKLDIDRPNMPKIDFDIPNVRKIDTDRPDKTPLKTKLEWLHLDYSSLVCSDLLFFQF